MILRQGSILDWFLMCRVYHTPGNSLEEVRKNLKEVIELVLEESGDEVGNQEFVALEMIEVEM